MVNSKNREYDAVIVGAGNGGLIAAAELALNGKNILLLEQHNILGGFSTSFVRGRFEFEASLHELCQLGPKENPGAIRTLFDRLNVPVEWIRVPEAYRIILTEENFDATLPFGIEEYISACDKKVPGSREVVTKFFDLANEIIRGTDYLSKSKGKYDVKYIIKNYPNLLKTASYSVDEVCDALKMSKEVKNILYAYWCYLGIPTSRMNFTIYAAMFHSYLTGGAYIPKFRSTEFVSALENKIRESGGNIECSTRVDNILVENGEVIGVKTSHGEIIKTKHVLANCSPNLIYKKMIEPKVEIPESAYKMVNARNLASSGIVVFLGLNKDVDELGFTDYSYFIYDNMDTDKMYENFSSFDNLGVQATVCLNNAIPDCSPKGTSIISITTLTKPEAWKNVEPKDYPKLKTKLADALIDKLEKGTGIKIRDYIEEIEIATPVTYANYTGAHQGIIYSYETDSWDAIIPRAMMMNEDNIIKGLRIVGGYGQRASGYSSAMSCGSIEALLTLAEMKQKEEISQ